MAASWPVASGDDSTGASATLARVSGAHDPTPVAAASPRARAGAALRRSRDWVQLAKFCAVGASGYVVNLAVYTLLLRGAGLHYIPAAVGSFLVAVTNNYSSTGSGRSASSAATSGAGSARFLVVSTAALLANLLVLHLARAGRGRRDPGAGHRDRARDAV